MEDYTKLKQHRVPLKDAVPLDMPFTLFVDPTNFCNFHCSFCPRNYDEFTRYAGAHTHMSKALFEKICDDLARFSRRLKVLRLFYLGEPLLCPDFLDILKLACQRNLAERLEVSTNASMLTCDVSTKILNIVGSYDGNFYLRISVYSVFQNKNKNITKNNIDIAKIKENVKAFFDLRNKKADLRNKVRIYAKMLKSYSDEDEKFISDYRDIVDEVELEEPMEWSGETVNGGLLKGVYSDEVVASLRNKVMPKVCAYPFHTLAINSDGKVVCCCVDWSRKTCVGDVKEESLYDIWHGERLKTLRLKHLMGLRNELDSCRNCMKLPRGDVYELDNLDNLSLDEFLRRGDLL